MGEKKAALTARALDLLRLTLLWARKGGAFKRGLFSGCSYRKGLRRGRGSGGIENGYQFRHGEKELSFDDTPVFRVRSTRSAGRKRGSMRILLSSLPCVNPSHPPDLDFTGDDKFAKTSGDFFFSKNSGEIVEDEREEKEFASADWLVGAQEGDEEEDEVVVFVSAEWEEGPLEPADEEDQEVDARAEEFIARFHQQMKLQQQASLLQYHEVLYRGT